MSDKKSDIGKISQFFPAGEIVDHYFAGYDDEIRAGMNLVKQATEGGVWRVLVFGFPGCGKSEFPFVLAAKANTAKMNMSLLYVKCHRLASYFEDANAMKRHLRELRNQIENFQPIILAFDEFDAISPRRENPNASLTELSLWAMSFLSNGNDVDSDRKMLFFGITNFPNLMDVAVRDRLQYPFHFGNASAEVIEKMLERNGIPNGRDVAGRILQHNSNFGQTVTGRGIALACKALRRLEKKNELGDVFKECDSSEIARAISVHAQPVRDKDISDWNELNRNLIEQSELVKQYWMNRS
jgi:SpoVK/Ycf46/Vps4 family AAA+-type ATPase